MPSMLFSSSAPVATLPPPPALAVRRPAFITPLMREDLFDVGVVFPREELTRRVLSLCWRDCCCPSCFSRAPAPVVEFAAEAADGTPAARLRAWWLLHDGILEDSEGPYSERLRPFLGGGERPGRLWPRYEFRVVANPAALELSIFTDSLSARGHRMRLSFEAGSRVRVIDQEAFALK